MNPKRKQRLFIVLFIVFGASIAVGLTAYALSNSINLFYSPKQIANGEAPEGRRLRVGGMVVENSVIRDPDSLKVQFDLTDFSDKVTVEFEGILPDLFREGQGIVAQGELNEDGVVEAYEVLAKHDENYMPPEVAQALKESGKMPTPDAEVFNK